MPHSLSVSMAFAVVTLGFLSSCTVHLKGETAERMRAAEEGKPYEKPVESRTLPELSPDASLEEMIRYALLSNAKLEQRYWQWKAAIERIPQEGTESANPAIFAGVDLDKGHFSLDRTTVTVGNDPMADLVLPPKLSAAARAAVENARAAEKRFDKAKFEIRSEVTDAYLDLVLNRELLRLEKANFRLLSRAGLVAEARNRSGTATQQDVLTIDNEIDLSRNEIVSLERRQPVLKAKLNAVLGRDVTAEIRPGEFPVRRVIVLTDNEILELGSSQSPELTALAHEIESKKEGVMLAKLQYLPDLSLSIGGDLGGMAQAVMSMMTVPVFRYEAIQGAIQEAYALLHSLEAMQRQARNDIAAELILHLTMVRDLDRQIELFEDSILPRAERAAALSRTAYEVGRSTLLELLDSRRSVFSLQKLLIQLVSIRERSLSSLERLTARPLVKQSQGQ
jgi:outer membrane protein TolC